MAIFLSFFKPHLGLLLLDLTSALGIALVDLSFPLLTRYGLQTLIPAGRYRFFAVMMLALLLAFIVRSLLQYVVTYWGHLLGVRMEADMRSILFSHLQTLSFSFYDHARTGHLMSRVVSDLFEIVELAHHGPEDLFIALVTLVGSFIAMLLIRWQLALILLIMIPLIVLITVLTRRRMADASAKVKEKTAVINADLENAISGVRVAKAFTNEDYEVEKFEAGNRTYRDAKRGFYQAMAIFNGGMELSTSTLNMVVIAIGAIFLVNGMMTLTDLLTFTLFVNSFLTPIRKLVSFFEQYANGMAGFRRFLQLMRLEPDIVDTPDAISLPQVKGNVRFDQVSFSYDGQHEVLHQVSLDIQAGQKVALVGPSGGGKTTLCQLLPRFYDVSHGRITVDQYDIRQVTLLSLRRQIGIVQQDVFLFAASVRDNIRYGRIDATDEEIIAAAKKAEIHDFIETLPEGYDTEVGERGARLSGGQKQRISIARIFLKNPAILVLDEATSALDTNTEIKIQRSLDKLAEGRTSLVIAHRLSTIRNADKIVYIDDEGIQEEGTHEALLKKGGRYARLYEAQAPGSLYLNQDLSAGTAARASSNASLASLMGQS
ncbi:ABC transporter ATP-binding protein [Oscillospiraceae bacterium HV4-5-C5C]|nr:ABC transporter ATP-binding protein [Oscillospiraceae bacterium HV4-5-C5C]